MDNVKVSVIMPVYNEEKYISNAIDSILIQTYKNWELIIVNDGSTDRTEKIVKQYTDTRIKYYSYGSNRKKAYASNIGLAKAQGEYIVCFDGDDIMMPHMLKRLVEYLDTHLDIVCAGGALTIIDEYGQILQDKVVSLYKKDEEIRAYMLFSNCMPCSGSMYRRDTVDKYDLKYDVEALVSQDYLFWINMLPYGKFVCIGEPLVYYRLHHSQSRKIVESHREWYDDYMRKILAYAWGQRGFDLEEEDIRLIYRYLFCKHLLWKPSDVWRTIKTYNRIKKQSKLLMLKEKEVIPYFFGVILRKSYWSHLFHNRIIKCLRKRRR